MFVRLTIVVLTAISPHAYAQELTAVLHPDLRQLDLAPYAQFIPSSTAISTPQEALVAATEALPLPTYEGPIDRGLGDGSSWYLFHILNSSSYEDFIIEIDNPRLADIDVSIFDGNQILDHARLGATAPYAERLLPSLTPCHPIPIPPSESRTLILRIENTGQSRAPVSLWEANTFRRQNYTREGVVFLLGGMMLLVVLVNGTIWLALRERGYLYIAFYIFSYVLFYCATTGIGHAYLWPDWSWLSERAPSLFGTVTLSFSILAVNALLGTPQTAPLLSRAAIATGTFGLCAVVFIMLTDSILRIYIAYLLLALALLFSLTMTGFAMRDGNPTAIALLCAWLISLAAWALGAMVDIGRLALPPWEGHTTTIGIIGSAIVFTYDIARRARHEEAQIRVRLEEQVEVRTQELRGAMENISTLESLLPMCAHCRKIRDQDGEWDTLETYINEHTKTKFSHGLCPDCLKIYEVE